VIVTTQISALQVRGLGRQKLAAVCARAKQLGMTPQGYLRHLVDEDLAISEMARRMSFAQMLGPGEEVDEAKLDRLVEIARIDYHRNRRRKE
jgi:hypothetical protein